MSQIQLHNPEFKFVEVGRIVLEDGKLAAIIQIIDHKRVLLEGPQVPRHAAALKNISLTKVKIDNLTFGAQHASLVSKWKESKIEEQYSKTPWAKRTIQNEKRRALTDFERFKVMKLRSQARYEVRRAHATVRAAATKA